MIGEGKAPIKSALLQLVLIEFRVHYRYDTEGNEMQRICGKQRTSVIHKFSREMPSKLRRIGVASVRARSCEAKVCREVNRAVSRFVKDILSKRVREEACSRPKSAIRRK